MLYGFRQILTASKSSFSSDWSLHVTILSRLGETTASDSCGLLHSLVWAMAAGSQAAGVIGNHRLLVYVDCDLHPPGRDASQFLVSTIWIIANKPCLSSDP